jgi:CRISPR-associated protein Csy2
MSIEIKKLLIIPRLKIHNANALSSPFTIGFPAMTAWLGAVHALQRKLNAKGFEVMFNATGIVSHQMDLQTYKGSNDFVHSIVGTGNPLDKTGSRSAFIEEARCHLDVSLVIQTSGLAMEQRDELLAAVDYVLQGQMKMAGGDIQQFKTPFFLTLEDRVEKDVKKLQRALMPGYVLLERRDLMIEAMTATESHQGQDGLDALIDYLAIHHTCATDDDDNVSWRSHRKSINGKPAGWIVPIATGFQGISALGQAKNQRDESTPHRFAESIVTLGEFKMPHRIDTIEQMLWRYAVDLDNDLYLCQQAEQAVLTDKTQQIDELNDSEFDGQ